MHVPASVFFCLDTERNRFVGAVNIRHSLNESLLRCGGHIGDGIHPSERGKGLGTQMIALALQECDKLGITRVLMCCNRDNPASARSIQKNGGVLENEVIENGIPVQRYWIDRSRKSYVPPALSHICPKPVFFSARVDKRRKKC